MILDFLILIQLFFSKKGCLKIFHSNNSSSRYLNSFYLKNCVRNFRVPYNMTCYKTRKSKFYYFTWLPDESSIWTYFTPGTWTATAFSHLYPSKFWLVQSQKTRKTSFTVKFEHIRHLFLEFLLLLLNR